MHSPTVVILARVKWNVQMCIFFRYLIFNKLKLRPGGMACLELGADLICHFIGAMLNQCQTYNELVKHDMEF